MPAAFGLPSCVQRGAGLAEPWEAQGLGHKGGHKDKGLTRAPGFPSKPDAPCVVRWKHGWWARHKWQEGEISKWCWWTNTIQTYSTRCDRVLEWVPHYYSMLVKNSHETPRAWLCSHFSVTSPTHPCPHMKCIRAEYCQAVGVLQTPDVRVFLSPNTQIFTLSFTRMLSDL